MDRSPVPGQRRGGVRACVGVWSRSNLAALGCGLLSAALPCAAVDATDGWFAPTAILFRPEPPTLYVGGRGGTLLATNLAGKGRSWSVNLGRNVTGLAWADGSKRLMVTAAGESNTISVVEAEAGNLLALWPAGHGVCSPVVRTRERIT